MPLPEVLEEAEASASPFSVPHPEPSSAMVYQLRPKHRMAEPITLRMSPPIPAEGWVPLTAIENERVATRSRSMSMVTEGELTDAKIAASEARGDTKIVRIEGKIDTMAATLGGKLDTVSERLGEHAKDRNLILGTIALAALAIIGAFIGLATYGDALFGRGMNVRDVVQAVMKEQPTAITPSLPPVKNP